MIVFPTMTPIGLWTTWLGFTGSIPEMYWNIDSEEQRYKWICKQVQKLAEYANYLGISFNEMVDTLNEMTALLPQYVNEVTAKEIARLVESGEFAEMVQAALDALADNVKAEIERLKAIESPVSIEAPPIRGTAILVHTDKAAILNDCGMPDDGTDLDAWLGEKLGDKKLSALIISHFDSDHWGSAATAMKYCDADTDVFVQMPPTAANGAFSYYETARETVENDLETFGLKAAIIPTEGEQRTYTDITLTLHNATLDNRTLYDSVPTESLGWGNTASGLNNYALIAKFEVGAVSIVNPADIEAAAQRVNAQYMSKCNVAFTPHHISGIGGYLPFWAALEPDIWAATLAASTYGGAIRIIDRYVVKLLRDGTVQDVVMAHKSPLEIKGSFGQVSIVSGDSLRETIGTEILARGFTSYYQILPAYYVNDNPLALPDLTARDLIAAGELATDGWEGYTYTPSTFGSVEPTILTELKTMWSNPNTTFLDGRNITFHLTRYLKAIVHAAAAMYSEVNIYGAYNLENRTGFRLLHAATPAKHQLGNVELNAFNLNTVLSQGLIDNVARSQHVNVVTAGGLSIGCFRTSNNIGDTPNIGTSPLMGLAMNEAMTSIYRVYITQNGVITGTSVPVGGGARSYITGATLEIVN